MGNYLMSSCKNDQSNRLGRQNAPTVSLKLGKASLNGFPVYNNKAPGSEAPILELWEMWKIPSLLLLPGQIRQRMVVLLGAQSLGQIYTHNNNRRIWSFIML